jgi:hypothetical protein
MVVQSVLRELHRVLLLLLVDVASGLTYIEISQTRSDILLVIDDGVVWCWLSGTCQRRIWGAKGQGQFQVSICPEVVTHW